MKKQTIQQHPERYEAPKVKIKELRRRAIVLALSLTGTAEGEISEDGGYSTGD